MKRKNELVELITSAPLSRESDVSSYKDYLLSLRSNRDELVCGILSSGRVKHKLEDKYKLLTKAKNIQNQTRGKLGELLGRVALTNHAEAKDSSLLTDKAVFDTPYGRRRIDVYWKEKRLAIETKMGFVTNSKSIRNQIEKDAFLVRNGDLDCVIWLLIKGASKGVKLNLKSHDLAFKEGWPL